MLKKELLTETVLNNSDPFQIREAVSAIIGAWQKHEKYNVLWETLNINTEYQESLSWGEKPDKVYILTAEAVYDAGN